MALLLQITGLIWFLLGAGNIIYITWEGGLDAVLGFGLMFNVLLFVLPGLVLLGIGKGIKKSLQPVASTATVTQLSVEDRLKELENLLDRNLITPEEHERKRAEILNGL
jgi:hypothetical protein